MPWRSRSNSLTLGVGGKWIIQLVSDPGEHLAHGGEFSLDELPHATTPTSVAVTFSLSERPLANTPRVQPDLGKSNMLK